MGWFGGEPGGPEPKSKDPNANECGSCRKGVSDSIECSQKGKKKRSSVAEENTELQSLKGAAQKRWILTSMKGAGSERRGGVSEEVSEDNCGYGKA